MNYNFEPVVTVLMKNVSQAEMCSVMLLPAYEVSALVEAPVDKLMWPQYAAGIWVTLKPTVASQAYRAILVQLK